MAIAVTTRSYDNARSGVNDQESVLTVASVRQHGVRRYFSLVLQGDARGVEAQPLVVPGVRLSDGTTREVIYLATMANQVWAFDAKDGVLLWERTFGTPVKGSRDIDHWGINDHWGILSTPVIDTASNTLYAVAWISPDGSVARAEHFLCAVDIRTGADAQPRVSLAGVSYEPGHGLPVISFGSAARKQRAALLLTSVDDVRTVFIAFGSIYETGAAARGWVIACATTPLRVTAAWASTARGHGAGIWQAGSGPVADAAGSLYVVTGSGDFDAITDFGESFVKLRYTPPAQARQASIVVEDWWSPFDDAARTGPGPRAKAAAARPVPTNFRANAAPAAGAEWDDMDVGSCGGVLIESHGLLVGSGKDGVLFVLDVNRMGKTTPADLTNPARNYAKLKSTPIFFTYYPPELNPAPQNITALNVNYADRTHHFHASPIYWDSPDDGPMLFGWGENENLRAWSVDASGRVNYKASSAEVASAQAPVPPGGMPGGMLTLSANGRQPHTGIVWATIPYFDANRVVGPGRLIAYDATVPHSSNQLVKLWDSQDWGLTFSFNKFNPPVVANGRLIVPTYDGRVDVYGPT